MSFAWNHITSMIQVLEHMLQFDITASAILSIANLVDEMI